jgi:hypothetical protein
LEDVRWNRSRLDVLVNWQRKDQQLKEGLKEVVENPFGKKADLRSRFCAFLKISCRRETDQRCTDIL